jgi:hypothetical protein
MLANTAAIARQAEASHNAMFTILKIPGDHRHLVRSVSKFQSLQSRAQRAEIIIIERHGGVKQLNVGNDTPK